MATNYQKIEDIKETFLKSGMSPAGVDASISVLKHKLGAQSDQSFEQILMEKNIHISDFVDVLREILDETRPIFSAFKEWSE